MVYINITPGSRKVKHPAVMYRYIFNLFLRGQDPLAGLIKRIRDETRDTFMKCGYIRQTWDCGNTREVEEKHTGRYGARGQKRQKRRKATPEEIAKQNQWKRERDVRRLIKWNFWNRRLLVHADIQERLTAALETDAERYVKIHSKAPGQV